MKIAFGWGQKALKERKMKNAKMKLAVSLVLAVAALPAIADSGVFWTRNSSTIWEADLGGNNAQTLISGPPNIVDITLDTMNNKLYWTDRSWGIYRANTDGTGVELIVPIENLSESSIAVTPEPATLLLLGFGISMLRTRKNSK